MIAIFKKEKMKTYPFISLKKPYPLQNIKWWIIFPHPFVCNSNQSIIEVILYVSIHDSRMYKHAVMYNHVINTRFKGSQPFKQFICIW